VYIGAMTRRIKGFSIPTLLRALAAAALWGLAALPLRADAFDHFLLALSWSPSWCATTGDARDAEVCDLGSGTGFTLHGLWPQHATGWPEFCTTDQRDPSRRETAAMADIMGSGSLAWYQWRKHGRCAGTDPADYFAAARAAFERLVLPDPPERVTAAELEEAFLALNPDHGPDGVIVTCRDGLALELRLCLTRDLAPRACGPDVLARACRSGGSLAMPPPR
jgi:ribonuclease T2